MCLFGIVVPGICLMPVAGLAAQAPPLEVKRLCLRVPVESDVERVPGVCLVDQKCSQALAVNTHCVTKAPTQGQQQQGQQPHRTDRCSIVFGKPPASAAVIEIQSLP
jgi:hypothetical protein